VAITLVTASKAQSSYAADLFTLAFAADVSSGSLLVAHITYGGTNPTITVSDNIAGGQTWTQAGSNEYDSTNVQGYALFYKYNTAASSGSRNVTLVASGANYVGIQLQEYTGVLATSNPLDQLSGTVLASTTTPATASVTPSTNNQLILCGSVASASSTITAAGSYSLIYTDTILASEYQVQTTAAGVTGAFSYSPASISCILVATFKASSGPPTESGSFVITDGQDTASIAAHDANESGSFVITDGQDTAAIAITPIGQGDFDPIGFSYFDFNTYAPLNLAVTDTQDTASIAASDSSGTGTESGSFAITDTQDTAFIVGKVVESGSFAVTDNQDSTAINARVVESGAFAVTDTQDVASIAGFNSERGTLSVTGTQDSASLVGIVSELATLAATDNQDSASIAANDISSGVESGYLLVTDAQDAANFTAALSEIGALAVTEAQDIAQFLQSAPLAASTLGGSALLTPWQVRQKAINQHTRESDEATLLCVIKAFLFLQ